jgi:transcriptional regulator with XRE-family HTH domain
MNYKKLEELREKTKVSSEKLGEVIGISGPGYAKMIKEHTCRVDYLEKLAGYFGVSITVFFEEELLKVDDPQERYHKACPLCKEKDRSIHLLEKIVSDLEAEKEQLTKACSDKEELLDWYKGKKETAPENSAQHRQAANE